MSTHTGIVAAGVVAVVVADDDVIKNPRLEPGGVFGDIGNKAAAVDGLREKLRTEPGGVLACGGGGGGGGRILARGNGPTPCGAVTRAAKGVIGDDNPGVKEDFTRAAISIDASLSITGSTRDGGGGGGKTTATAAATRCTAAATTTTAAAVEAIPAELVLLLCC